MAKKRTKIQTYFDNLKEGETAFLRTEGFQVPGGKKCQLPCVVECQIVEKEWCVGYTMSLHVRANNQEGRISGIRLNDISRNRETIEKRVLNELKKWQAYYRKSLKKAESRIAEMEKQEMLAQG